MDRELAVLPLRGHRQWLSLIRFRVQGRILPEKPNLVLLIVFKRVFVNIILLFVASGPMGSLLFLYFFLFAELIKKKKKLLLPEIKLVFVYFCSSVFVFL